MGDKFASKALKEGDQTHFSCAAAQDSEKWARKGIECWEGDGRVVVRQSAGGSRQRIEETFSSKVLI